MGHLVLSCLVFFTRLWGGLLICWCHGVYANTDTQHTHVPHTPQTLKTPHKKNNGTGCAGVDHDVVDQDLVLHRCVERERPLPPSQYMYTYTERDV